MITNSQGQTHLFGIHYSNKCNTDDTSLDSDFFSKEELPIHDNIDKRLEAEDPCDHPLTLTELELAIDDLTNSATGPDLVHNQMLQDLPPNAKRSKQAKERFHRNFSIVFLNQG